MLFSLVLRSQSCITKTKSTWLSDNAHLKLVNRLRTWKSLFSSDLVIAALTSEKFIAVSDCKRISVTNTYGLRLACYVTGINTFWERQELCPTV